MRAPVVAALAAVLALGACSNLPGDLYANDLDVARAQHVWSDPWVAPISLGVASGAYGSNDQVSRRVGTRETWYAVRSTARVARTEIAAALAAGWTLTGVECTEDGIRAVLVEELDDLDAAAAAEIEAVSRTIYRLRRGSRDRGRGPAPPRRGLARPRAGRRRLEDDLPGRRGARASRLPRSPTGTTAFGDVDDDVDSSAWSERRPVSADDEARARRRCEDDAWFAGTRRRAVPSPSSSRRGPDSGARRQRPRQLWSPAPVDRRAALAAVVATR